jgi:hypothetical protein
VWRQRYTSRVVGCMCSWSCESRPPVRAYTLEKNAIESRPASLRLIAAKSNAAVCVCFILWLCGASIFISTAAEMLHLACPRSKPIYLDFKDSRTAPPHLRSLPLARYPPCWRMEVVGWYPHNSGKQSGPVLPAATWLCR